MRHIVTTVSHAEVDAYIEQCADDGYHCVHLVPDAWSYESQYDQFANQFRPVDRMVTSWKVVMVRNDE